MLRASSSNFATTGGAATHTLTRAELPAGISGSVVLHSVSIGTNIQSATGVFSGGSKNPKYRAGGDLIDGATSLGSINYNLGGSSTPFDLRGPFARVCVHVRAG